MECELYEAHGRTSSAFGLMNASQKTISCRLELLVSTLSGQKDGGTGGHERIYGPWVRTAGEFWNVECNGTQ